MQKQKGTWTKVAAVTVIFCVLLGIGYTLIRNYFQKAGYFWEVRLPTGQKFTIGETN